MKKKILLLLLLCSTVSMLSAQVTYTGRVQDELGTAIPFATVLIKGTNRGTSTNQDGQFSISARSGEVLVVSALGFDPGEITLAASAIVSITLVSNDDYLQEVIVSTGYGIRQTQRSTTSNAQVVTSERLNVVRQQNINSAIAGKVAGLQIREQSGAKVGVNNAVRLRGDGNVGGSSLIYIVDGTIVAPADINMDDVEDVTVLSGPTGAAIYGPQAANGAMVITLKKGRRTKGVGLEVNTATQFSRVYVLPKFQDEYAGGASANLIQFNWQPHMPAEWQALDGKYYHDYSDDASWGPKMTGQEYIPWYAWYPGHSNSFKTSFLTPQPDNVRDFYQTGIVTTNNFNFSTATEKAALRISYTNQNTTSIVPNTWLKKHTLNLSGSLALAKWLTVGANVNFVTQKFNGENNDGYSNQTSGSFSQWFHRNLEMDKLKEYRALYSPGLAGEAPIIGSWNRANPNAYSTSDIKTSYGANYWYNPYAYFDNVVDFGRRDRLYGDVFILLQPVNDFTLRFTHRKNLNETYSDSKTRYILERSGRQTGVLASYGTGMGWALDDRFEFIATYTKKINDLDIRLVGGTEFINQPSRSLEGSTNGGLYIPDFFSVLNSVNAPSWSTNITDRKNRGIFGRVNLNYDDWFYLDGTIRNDYFSTLNTSENNILVKSFGAAVVFSHFLEANIPWLSLGKLRFSWGETPEAIGPYGLVPTYAVGATRYNNKFTMSETNVLISPTLTGAKQIQKELGVDLKFIKNRFGVSVTYYEAVTLNSPINVNISSTTGYSSQRINAGRIERSGLDFQVFLNPVQTHDFTWEINANLSRNLDNKVVKLADNLTQFSYSNGVSFNGITTPRVNHMEGEQWGMLMGGGKLYDPATGLPVVETDGTFVQEENKRFGSILPDFTGGIQNTFSYKNLVFNVNMDFQKGGKFFSLSQMFGSYSGLLERTAGKNDKGVDIRTPVADGGGVRVQGVTRDGQHVDVYVEALDYFHNQVYANVFDEFIDDLSYFKVRELSLGYRFPLNKVSWGKHFTNIVVSVIATNPWLINAGKKDFDPSEISGQYGENGQFPSVRSFGVNIRLGL